MPTCRGEGSTPASVAPYASEFQLDAGTADTARVLQERAERLVDALDAGGLASLEDAVTGADREPTTQDRAVFAELRSRLAQWHADWEALTRDLARLNGRLARRHVPEIVPAAVQPERLVVPAGLGERR